MLIDTSHSSYYSVYTINEDDLNMTGIPNGNKHFPVSRETVRDNSVTVRKLGEGVRYDNS